MRLLARGGRGRTRRGRAGVEHDRLERLKGVVVHRRHDLAARDRVRVRLHGVPHVVADRVVVGEETHALIGDAEILHAALECVLDNLADHAHDRLVDPLGHGAELELRAEVALVGGVILSLGPNLPISGYAATLVFLCYVACRLVARYRSGAGIRTA